MQFRLRYNPLVPRRVTIHARRASLVGSAGGSRVRRFGVRIHPASCPRCPLRLSSRHSRPPFLLTDSLPTELKLHSSSGRDLRGLQVEIDDPHRAVVDSVTINE